MKKHFKIYLMAASFVFAAGNSQPLHAGEVGAFFGAIIGAIFGSAVEDASNQPPPPEPSHHCVYVNRARVKEKIRNKIDSLCRTYQQSHLEQREINKIKARAERRVNNKINQSCYYTSQSAFEDCDDQAREELANYLSARARELALQEGLRWHQRPPVNPIYVNDIDARDFAREIAQQVYHEVEQQYRSNRNGSLQDYWGQRLRSKITTMAQRRYQRAMPRPSAPSFIDYTQIERDMMWRIDRLCATSSQSSYKQRIIHDIKNKARRQLMYDIRHKHYNSHGEAQADAVQKLNSFLPEILQDYTSNKEYVKQRAVEAMERNVANGLKYLISDEL